MDFLLGKRPHYQEGPITALAAQYGLELSERIAMPPDPSAAPMSSKRIEVHRRDRWIFILTPTAIILMHPGLKMPEKPE